MSDELPQVFFDAKLVGEDYPPTQYLAQTAKRGDKEFAISRGMLMDLAWNPHRWRAGFARKATDATELGNVLEVLPLQPHRWADMFSVEPTTYTVTMMQCPECGSQTDSQKCAKCKRDRVPVAVDKPWRYGSKVCDEWKEAVTAKGRIPICKAIADGAEAARTVLRQDERIEELLSISRKQVCVTATYRDHPTGLEVPVKCLIDGVPDKAHQFYGHTLFDFKTTRSVNNPTWPFTVDEYNLDAQAALELDLWNALTGEMRDGFLHVVQESYEPFEAGRKFLSLRFIDLGRQKILNALAVYCRCLKENRWPGPDTDPSPPSQSIEGWTLIEPTGRMAERALQAMPEIQEPPLPYEQDENDLIP